MEWPCSGQADMTDCSLKDPNRKLFEKGLTGFIPPGYEIGVICIALYFLENCCIQMCI